MLFRSVLGVVCAAISDLGYGFVAIFVVVEAHVCPCGESAVKLGLFGVEAGKRIKQAGNERGKRRLMTCASEIRRGVNCTLVFTVPRDLEPCHVMSISMSVHKIHVHDPVPWLPFLMSALCPLPTTTLRHNTSLDSPSPGS